jgi:hypothetical protein
VNFARFAPPVITRTVAKRSRSAITPHNEEYDDGIHSNNSPERIERRGTRNVPTATGCLRLRTKLREGVLPPARGNGKMGEAAGCHKTPRRFMAL